MLLAENLFRLRKQRRLTQEQLAAQVGVTFQSVSKWETGQTLPDVALLPALAGILNVSIDALLGYLPAQNKISEYESSRTKSPTAGKSESAAALKRSLPETSASTSPLSVMIR